MYNHTKYITKIKNMTTGKIGVSTQDLFPIIKKFLYSDHEIFLREIVSNAVDATQKMKTIAGSGKDNIVGDYNLDDIKIRVNVNKKAKTITISDRGIGMTKDEVEKYINQIAFSGAEEFLNKYKDTASAIIGHFGLGFYSAFMVSDKVEIITKSYQNDSPAVKWACEGTTDYSLEDTNKSERGTDIIMHISKDAKDFLEENKIEALLKKYCKFLPIEIVFGKKKEWKDGKNIETDEDNIINNTTPLWTKKPSDLKDEDYANFYKELYPFAPDPLFHIHLNVDYPFTLTGILYFPKISSKLELQKNKIQLYANQVYVTDSIEGIVPDYLTLLHGVIDSPDIPLNVSRSYLQSDNNVKKISNHITKKVSDSLLNLFKNERADYEKKWDDLKIFVQYGILSDTKFAEKALDFFLYKNTDGKYYAVNDYVNAIKDLQTDKDSKTVLLYTNKATEQYTYIQSAKGKGYDVLLMDGMLDTPFINYVESKDSNVRFVSVDSDVADRLIPKEDSQKTTLSEEEQKSLKEIITEHLPKEGHFDIDFSAMGENTAPAIITRSEYMRRIKDMAEVNPQMAFYGNLGDQYTLVVNTDQRVVKKIIEDVKNNAVNQSIVGQIIDIALLSNNLLSGEALAKFLKRSVEVL
ncbi:chaperone protein htpG [Bacteroidia bacterium]|nr:chaperone protein htpG [Bacteroidia bacterium]